MELVRVTNAGLQMTDGTVIPVIRAVLRDYAGAVSQTDANNLMLEIYNRSIGMVAACGYFTSKSEAFVFGGATSGSVTHGDDTGFKCTRHLSGSGTHWQACYFDGLWYKGNRVGGGTVYTGYSDYEYGFVIIFTDEDYHLIRSTSNTPAGIQIRSSTNFGATEANDMCVCGLWSDGEYRNIQDSWQLISDESIEDKITNEIDPDDTDPYAPGGDSGTGGGTGNFDGTGDDIDIPSLPTLSATDTGFITLFNPTTGQLQSLANYMWSSGFDLDTFKKLFADPMDCILGLSIVPVAVPNGGSRAVSVGNISTGVSMTVAARQYVEVDCGTLNVNEYWGAYLDYAPFTKAELYLPYIGTHPIDVDDIMNKAVHVVYHVDILSGACTAFVKCGGSVLYEFIGQCSSSIPVTGNDWTNVINGVLSVAGAIGSMVATGGASAPLAAGMIASTAVNSMKPTVEKSGSMSGTGGMLAVQTPYLILTRPNQARPAKQNAYTGYPSFITSKLGSLSGYTEIEEIHLDGIPGTEQEVSEIESLLKTGVII